MSQFVRGEIVNVHIDGVRYNHLDAVNGEHEVLVDGARYQLPAAAVIKRVAPKEYPPRAGDIWTNALGYEWLGKPDGSLFGVDTGDRAAFEQINRTDGPLTLVRRRGWTPEPAPVAEQVETDRRARLVQQLRAAADWIERHPDISVSSAEPGTVRYCAGSADELEDVAAQVGATVTDVDGHLIATVDLDGLTYRAFHVPQAAMPGAQPKTEAAPSGDSEATS